MLKKSFVAIAFVLGSFCLPVLYGQEGSGNLHISQMQNELENLMRRVDRDGDAGNGLETVGSPYVDPEFKMAVIQKGDLNIPGVYARYNAAKDELEMKIEAGAPESETYLMNRSAEMSCRIGSEHYVFSDYILDGVKKQGYLVAVVEDGYYRLFKKQTVYYREGKVAQNSLVGDVPNKFVQEEEWLLSVDGGTPETVKLKKKQLLEAMPQDHAKVARELLKEMDYNPGREADLAAFFSRLNTGIAADTAQ